MKAAWVALVLLAACGDPALAPPAGLPELDAGADAVSPHPDGGPADGGPADGGPADGGPADGGPADSGPADSGPADGGPADGGADLGTIAQRCFADLLARNPGGLGPSYDQFSPVIGNHCYGTDHQEIAAVERVVFLGDSITVGTPPTLASDVYRARLADRLAARFGLRPPDLLWKSANPFTGETALRSSGDFASCARWGARTDDLAAQIADCFPAAERHKQTLVILTIGGNDVAAITQDGAHAPFEQSRARTEAFVALLREAVRWLKDPANLPGGAWVIFSNMYEFTDATGDFSSCPTASLAGFGEPWDRPEDLEHLVLWATEQYMAIAVETRSDLLLLLEHFCGHGFRNDDPSGRCYRGPGAERWLDLTCIHPNPTGHARIAEMFLAVVEE